MKRRFWVWGNSAVRPGREVYTRPVGQLLRGRTSEYGQGTLLQQGRVLKGAGNVKGAVETQFSTGWYWPILRLMTTRLHSTTSPSCTQDTFPHSRLVRIVAHLRVLAHLCIPSRIFAFHRASSCFTAHLRVPSCIFAFHRASSRFIAYLRVSSQFSAHHCRSIHPLSSQFLGASHSIYYYICLCLASYDYYFVMDPYITSFTYLERSRFASEPWEGAYVRLRVAMSVLTT